MRIAVYHNNSDIRVEQRSVPEIGPGELRVRVMASGICGSDVMEWYRIKKAPLVLGHEIAGVIEEAGPDVDQFKAGDGVPVEIELDQHLTTKKYVDEAIAEAIEVHHPTPTPTP